MWEVEAIPDADLLYYRVHDGFFNKKGTLGSSVFREKGDGEERGISTDWSKYSTPEQDRGIKNPLKNSVVSFVTGDLRNIRLQVLHAPINENRAHTNVKGIAEPN